MKHGEYLRPDEESRITHINDSRGKGSVISLAVIESGVYDGDLEFRAVQGSYVLTLSEEERLLKVLKRREAVRRGWLS